MFFYIHIIYSTSSLIFDRLGGGFSADVYRFNQILKSSATDSQGRKRTYTCWITDIFFSQLIKLNPYKYITCIRIECLKTCLVFSLTHSGHSTPMSGGKYDFSK